MSSKCRFSGVFEGQRKQEFLEAPSAIVYSTFHPREKYSTHRPGLSAQAPLRRTLRLGKLLIHQASNFQVRVLLQHRF